MPLTIAAVGLAAWIIFSSAAWILAVATKPMPTPHTVPDDASLREDAEVAALEALLALPTRTPTRSARP